jgi:hypothetical protein
VCPIPTPSLQPPNHPADVSDGVTNVFLLLHPLVSYRIVGSGRRGPSAASPLPAPPPHRPPTTTTAMMPRTFLSTPRRAWPSRPRGRGRPRAS